MDIFPRKKEQDPRMLDLLRRRELQESAARSVSKKLQVTESFISRLGLETELQGHTGCVNCLEWNENGEILASASDDWSIILWDPFKYEKKLVLPTGHTGNIFTVKFLPKSEDTLVTGAADSKIRVHDITLSDTKLVCKCHYNRVKRIATAPNTPDTFWSAAEDGLILQYDLRMPHVCRDNDNPNVLINLTNHIGRYVEAKCLAINPRRPELVAVGANDAYIRMYDRRMIKLSKFADLKLPFMFAGWIRGDSGSSEAEGDPDNNIPMDCAQYFIAGHLHSQLRDQTRSLTTTYLTFSADGNELLVNMGGEQIYLFDINKQNHCRMLISSLRQDCADSGNNKYCIGDHEFDLKQDYASLNVVELPKKVEELKQHANDCFDLKKYNLAIILYNKAICLCPTSSILYANRAAAYMKRDWKGDVYAALRDCQVALLLDPDHVKALFRVARCLHDLNRASEALKVIEYFQKKFPDYSTNASFKALKKDIKKACSNTGKDATYASSEYETHWRNNTIDYKMRFCGHCNTTTDIKEANFFGNDGQYIVAGSDDGSFFIWERDTTNIVRVLRGDDRIVNCLQPHPSTCLLATSGIESVIRLWSPLPENGAVNEREIQNLDDAALANQYRMNSDPFELMLMNMGFRIPSRGFRENESGSAESDDLQVREHPLNCTPS